MDGADLHNFVQNLVDEVMREPLRDRGLLLQRLAQATDTLVLRARRQVAYELREQGVSLRESSRLLGCDHRSTERYVQAHADSRMLPHLETPPRSVNHTSPSKSWTGVARGS